MILADSEIQRVHEAQVAVLRIYADAFRTVRADAADAPIGTGHALFAGEGSPLTQVRGFAHRTPGDPGEIAGFFEGRAREWEVSVTPFTDPETVRALLASGYGFEGFEGVLARPTDEPPARSNVEIQEAGADLQTWMEATGRGWGDDESPAFHVDELVRAAASARSRKYVAVVDGQPAAAAQMIDLGDVVVLGGGATRAPYRGRGLQSALLARRLQDAGPGRLALVGGVPGTASHRNSQRAGFVPLYSTVTLVYRPAPTPL